MAMRVPLHLRALPPEQLKTALIAMAPATHASTIATMSHSQAQQLAANAMAIGDRLIGASSAPAADTAGSAADLAQLAKDHPIAFSVAQGLHGEAIWAKWGATDTVNPLGGPQRRKAFPVKLIPANVTLSAAGAGTLSWAPQEECEPFRIEIPSGQAAANNATYAANLLVGDRLMQAQSGRMPINCFRENSDMGRIDMPIVRLGEIVSLAISGGTGNAELSALLWVYARGKPRYLPEGSQILGERYEPFDVTTIAQSGTATINLQPQRHLILRRIGFDDGALNFANVYVTSITVQDDPQFLTGQEILGQSFSELAVDDWLDCDLCQIGGLIAIGVRNANTSANAVVQGMAVCDLVRLPTDPR